MRVPARAWMAALLTASAGLPLQVVAAATPGGVLSLTSHPLPMAVEGGTLAEVTAHAVPFPLGSSTLDGGIAAALEAILATAATDCFLFAQIVGHVQPGPAADGDTRAAHRLARARADFLAAALQRAGMPAGSVATTWDFAFATPQPRATLWLFERMAGTDCHGTPLPGAPPSAAIVAAADAGAPTSAAVASASDPLEPAPGIHLPRPDTLASAASAAETASEVSDLEPAPGIHLPAVEVAAADGPEVEPAVGDGSQGEPDGSEEERLAASVDAARITAPEPQAGPPSAGVPGTPTSTGPNTVEITFDPDSSFLSQAALAELEAWRSVLPGSAHVCRVEVVATVGDRAGRLQPERARLYNEWLAERRRGRLIDWLRTRSECELREVRLDFQHHDESRRVLLRLSAEPASDPLAAPGGGAGELNGNVETLSRSPAPAGSPASPAPRRA